MGMRKVEKVWSGMGSRGEVCVKRVDFRAFSVGFRPFLFLVRLKLVWLSVETVWNICLVQLVSGWLVCDFDYDDSLYIRVISPVFVDLSGRGMALWLTNLLVGI
jgi:hypothetical protein